MTDEPTTVAAVQAWVAEQNRGHDPFAAVYDASEQHRVQHGAECTVYPSSNGRLLTVIAAATRPQRILEVGCGLGYSALCLLRGAAPSGIVDTIEADPLHAQLAREHFRQHDAERINIIEGRAVAVVSGLIPPYNLVFCDGDPDEYPALLDHFVRLLAPAGLLVTSNLFLGVYVPDAPYLVAAATYRQRIVDHPALTTSFLSSGLALSVKG
jgi:predicted O-methyltransferase YrrM